MHQFETVFDKLKIESWIFISNVDIRQVQNLNEELKMRSHFYRNGRQFPSHLLKLSEPEAELGPY